MTLMQYRKDRFGRDLSLLGFGCMRFTRQGGSIDIQKAEREIMAAYRAGVNYFDTAYIYPGSEAALGEILERNGIRSEIALATKLPQYLIGTRTALERCFSEQLSRLRTDYIDYYFMHHLTDAAMWEKLQRIGIEDWIREKKQAGSIKNIGFSYHGNTENFLRILDAYDWDICLIQYNYLDERTQAGVDGLRAAAARGIPVVIMEPLRGGKLVDMLPKEAVSCFSQSGRDWTNAEWAFRWLYDQKEVSVVLSGMNSVAMVEENCRTASDAAIGGFSASDHAVIAAVKKQILAGEKVGCTGCRYCLPCPAGVDIPGIFRSYNTMFTETKHRGRFQFAQTVALTKAPVFASQCIGCGKCEQHCPQNLPIRKKLKEADRALRPLPYQLGIHMVRAYLYGVRAVRKQKQERK